MQAIYAKAYGDATVLEMRSVAKPILKESEILIKVKASPVSTADALMRKGEPKFARLFLGVFKPKSSIPGTGFSGVVVEVGQKVESFAMGDEVFGETSLNFGAHGEYLKLQENDVILKKPSNLFFEEAACLCDGPLTSYHFLSNLIQLKVGQKVLINGASGSLGLAALQIARQKGAEVTGICSSKNKDLVMHLGADHHIDYRVTPVQEIKQKFDVVFDTIGKSSFKEVEPLLYEEGKYICPVLSFSLLLQMLLTRKKKKQALFTATGLKKPAELKVMLEKILILLCEKQLRITVEQEFDVHDFKKAHEFVDTGRKVGNVVLRFMG